MITGDEGIMEYRKKVLSKTVWYVRRAMPPDSTGHDWWHVYRVWKNALKIAKYEKSADKYIVQLGALLHDIADYKFNGGDELAGGRIAAECLKRASASEETISRVCHIVDNVSYRGARVKNEMKSIEGKIVQDADRLDALGAIGIARAFAYGGMKGKLIYEPKIRPVYHKSFNEYKSSQGTTINHFYEKLFLLHGRMNTKIGKELAEERDEYMRGYLKQFLKEWKVSP